MDHKNDMTIMYAFHDALRRDLERLARVTARADDDPKHILRTAVGWEMFKSYLQLHHSAEEDLLWPPMRDALAVDSPGMALLDATEAEHAAIDPLRDSLEPCAPTRCTHGSEGAGRSNASRLPGDVVRRPSKYVRVTSALLIWRKASRAAMQ